MCFQDVAQIRAPPIITGYVCVAMCFQDVALDLKELEISEQAQQFHAEDLFSAETGNRVYLVNEGAKLSDILLSLAP